jgi:hypothetical protein
MQGATEEPRSIPSSKHANSTTSILRLGSPTCWHASQTIQQIRSPISCHGIGKPRVSPSPPDRSRAQDPGSPAVLAGWIPAIALGSAALVPAPASAHGFGGGGWHGGGHGYRSFSYNSNYDSNHNSYDSNGFGGHDGRR